MTMFRIRRKGVLEEKIVDATTDVENILHELGSKTNKLMDLRQDLKEWR